MRFVLLPVPKEYSDLSGEKLQYQLFTAMRITMKSNICTSHEEFVTRQLVTAKTCLLELMLLYVEEDYF